jgi:hypothetical protein
MPAAGYGWWSDPIPLPAALDLTGIAEQHLFSNVHVDLSTGTYFSHISHPAGPWVKIPGLTKHQINQKIIVNNSM